MVVRKYSDEMEQEIIQALKDLPTKQAVIDKFGMSPGGLDSVMRRHGLKPPYVRPDRQKREPVVIRKVGATWEQRDRRRRRPAADLTEEQISEIVQLYRDTDTSPREIKQTYGIGTHRLYRILEKHHVPAKRHLRRANGEAAVDRDEMIVQTRVIEPRRHVEIKVDKEGLVQEVRETGRDTGRYIWEVRFYGSIEIRADTPEEALRQARRINGVQRISAVLSKGARDG